MNGVGEEIDLDHGRRIQGTCLKKSIKGSARQRASDVERALIAALEELELQELLSGNVYDETSDAAERQAREKQVVEVSVPDQGSNSQTEGQAFLKLLGWPVLTVAVGPNPDPSSTWCLPEALLFHHSAYFRKHKVENERGGFVALPDVENDVFAMFVEWIYFGVFTSPTRKQDFTQSEVVTSDSGTTVIITIDEGIPCVNPGFKAYVLGEKLCNAAFTEYVMRRIFNTYTPPCIDTASVWMTPQFGMPIRIHDIEYVCRNTDKGSTLQHYLFNAIGAFWEDQDIKSSFRSTIIWQLLCDEFPDFARSVRWVKRLRKRCWPRPLRRIHLAITPGSGWHCENIFCPERLKRCSGRRCDICAKSKVFSISLAA